MKVVIVKDYQGTEEIHKDGCADLKRRNRPYRLSEAMRMETDYLRDIYREYWDCIADESVAGGDYPDLEHVWYAWQGEFSVKPCASALISMEDPDKDFTFSARFPAEDKHDHVIVHSIQCSDCKEQSGEGPAEEVYSWQNRHYAETEHVNLWHHKLERSKSRIVHPAKGHW